MSDEFWTLDAVVAADGDGKTTLFIGRNEDLPEGWATIVSSPITVDGLGNFGDGESGRLPDHAGIERLALAGEVSVGPFANEATPGLIQIVEAVLAATRNPLATPHLLAAIAQLLSVVGLSAFQEHPAVRGVPVAPVDRAGASSDALWRAPFLDAIIVGDSTLILRATADRPEVVVLEGVHASVWSAADGSAADDTVSRVCSDGERVSDRQSSVHEAVQELLQRSLLRNEPSWRRHPLTSWVEGDNHAALLAFSPAAASPLMLEGSAYSVWEYLCARQATDLDDLLTVIARQYGVEVDDIDEDVRGLLQRLGEGSAVAHV